MINQFSVLLLIGTYFTITTALLPCVCPRDKKEVCGSDGFTYNNVCLLKCQQANKPSLALRGQGPCKEITPGCFCGYDDSPLCASDGKNYASECEFKCQQAVKPGLTVRNNGKCRKRRQVAEDEEENDAVTSACEENSSTDENFSDATELITLSE